MYWVQKLVRPMLFFVVQAKQEFCILCGTILPEWHMEFCVKSPVGAEEDLSVAEIPPVTLLCVYLSTCDTERGYISVLWEGEYQWDKNRSVKQELSPWSPLEQADVFWGKTNFCTDSLASRRERRWNCAEVCPEFWLHVWPREPIFYLVSAPNSETNFLWNQTKFFEGNYVLKQKLAIDGNTTSLLEPVFVCGWQIFWRSFRGRIKICDRIVWAKAKLKQDSNTLLHWAIPRKPFSQGYGQTCQKCADFKCWNSEVEWVIKFTESCTVVLPTKTIHTCRKNNATIFGGTDSRISLITAMCLAHFDVPGRSDTRVVLVLLRSTNVLCLSGQMCDHRGMVSLSDWLLLTVQKFGVFFSSSGSAEILCFARTPTEALRNQNVCTGGFRQIFFKKEQKIFLSLFCVCLQRNVSFSSFPLSDKFDRPFAKLNWAKKTFWYKWACWTWKLQQNAITKVRLYLWARHKIETKVAMRGNEKIRSLFQAQGTINGYEIICLRLRVTLHPRPRVCNLEQIESAPVGAARSNLWTSVATSMQHWNFLRTQLGLIRWSFFFFFRLSASH